MSHVDDALDTVNNDYAPGNAGNNVWGDAREVQRHGGGGEIQQSTKKAATETAMATEMGTVTDSDDKDVNANANDSASTTVTRTTLLGCALRW